ncbi:MAG: DUF4349 domain-containing protein [Chloroflexota bacterium]|nr:DUF4349 domain-containing protein [Chloroflexota bacterium]MDE2920977.1 DUF4349 domain-containing protein [Chloroflexota bacterium]
MPKRFRVLAAALVVGALALAACGEFPFGGDEESFERSMAAPAAVMAAQPAAAMAESESGRMSRDTATTMGMAAERAAVRVAEGPASQVVVKEVPVEAAAMKQVVVESEQAAPARRVIRDATVGIVVGDVDEAVRQLQALVDGIPEAFVDSADVRDDDPRSISTVRLRVPVERFDEARRLVRELGSEVLFEAVGGRDVTADFTDLEARLRTAQATEQQLLDILATARTVSDTLEVQRELLEVRSRIEVFQGQLNLLANQTDLATITVQLHPAPDLRIERFSPEGYAMHGSTELPITIANHGTVDLRDVMVRDQLAVGMVFEWASSQGVYEAASHSVIWEFDRLEANSSRDVWSRVRLEGDGEPMQVSATITASGVVREPSEDRAETTLAFFVDLSVFKEGEASVPVGRDVTYFLSFQNHGNGDAREVRLTERLPQGMTFVRAEGGGRYDEGSRTVVWEFPRMSPESGQGVFYEARVDRSEGRFQTETTIESADEDRADVDNRVVTFLTALPEDVAGREVFGPGSTARDAVGLLLDVLRFLANAAIVLVIVAGPFAVVGVLGWRGIRTIKRRRG